MSKTRLSLLAASLLLAGAGCLGGGGAKGDDGGIFLSTDGGGNWLQSVALPGATGVSSIGSADITAIEMDPSDTSALYLGTRGNGMLFSLDSGASWQRPESEQVRSGTVVDVEVDARDVCTVYVAKTDRIMKTDTCGREFEEVYVQGTNETLTDIAIDWYNPNTMYVGTTSGDLLRTMDGGTTWATIARLKHITSLVVSNADSRVLLVGTRSDGLFRSTDSGATWTEYEKTLGDYRNANKVFDLAQSADGTAVYMTSKYGILVSRDNGAAWTSVPLITSGGEVEITAIAVDPNDGEHVIYGTAYTLHSSTSGGSAWMTESLPTSRAVSSLLIHPENGQTVIMGAHAIED